MTESMLNLENLVEWKEGDKVVIDPIGELEVVEIRHELIFRPDVYILASVEGTIYEFVPRNGLMILGR